ncbi:hypothetical protein DYI37_04270 [Fulvimarina endophytica]|uniref:Uncharacterized protein n=1 Tax=Fulvimarina endophytica TaxID=2293836 RepID=A0A371X779_9HYPH|nr:hypothetical protein [Fulvimarina endophytica]RFC65083.1 hypothetical protein DYI37_04270 [Fulvimarina endophytica]
MATVLRFLIVIPFAFVLSCLTSAFTILWPYLDLADTPEMHRPFAYIDAAFAFWAQSGQIGSTLLIPWTIFMALTEMFGLNSLVLHLVAGLVGSVAIILVAYGSPPPSVSIQAAILISGTVFALTYWVVAGRRAGAWRPLRRSRRAEPAPQAAIDPDGKDA